MASTTFSSAPPCPRAANAAIRDLVAAHQGAWTAADLAELARLQAAWLAAVRRSGGPRYGRAA